MGDHARALDFALRAAALAEQTGSRDVLWKCRYRAGQAYAGLRRFTEARRAFEASIAVIEGLRDDMAGGEAEREQFFESRVGPYRALAELLITLNQKEDAFLAAERAKARVLLDVLQSGQRSVTKAMTPEEQGKETRLQSELAALRTQMYREKLRAQPDPTRLTDLNARLQQARTQWEAFRTQLYAAHPRLKALRGESAPLTWKEVRQSLPHPKSVVLEFLVTEDTTFLFVLTREGLRLHAIAVPRKTLSRRIDQFRQQLARRDLGFRAAALALYNLLLKPAQEQLKDKTTLILIPDGVLWELPFQALQPVPTRYLLQEFALCYAPSLSALREMSRSRPAASSLPPGPLLLAVGNPALVSTSPVSSLRDITLAPLPETEKEVAALRQLYSGPNSRIYIGAQAQERRVKAEAGGVHVLHLATHGILDDRRPLYSCLVLSQDSAGSGEDGLLEAWEIMALDLHADLTVLSGCETARGGVRTGEGVIGLTWALFVAGCRTAVVSQWKVEAASTTRLMVAFHQRLRSAPAVGQPATALRLAALQLMKDSRYRHPFYWAGFIVIGRGL
jgi:CHAT domain-containing protein